MHSRERGAGLLECVTKAQLSNRCPPCPEEGNVDADGAFTVADVTYSVDYLFFNGPAPLAVAICSDPELSRRYVQDGCIAAYHFMLTAWFFGLGTCWIAAVDREDVKSQSGIPEHHYIVTITPLGYPKHLPLNPPERKELACFIRE